MVPVHTCSGALTSTVVMLIRFPTIASPHPRVCEVDNQVGRIPGTVFVFLFALNQLGTEGFINIYGEVCSGIW